MKPKKTKNSRVEVVDSRGNIARPLVGDLQKWIDAGWKRVKKVTDKESDNG